MKNNKPDIMIAFLISLAFFIELLDTTIINTSIPQMAISFNVPETAIKLAITSYLIALAIFIPISGWFADKFGSRTIFCSAIFIFTISSLFCGLSNSIYELAFYRTLQGIGGALMTPVGRLIILQTFDKNDLIKIMSYISIPALFGQMIGPLLGGIITTFYSWHWIFFVNIPLGIILFSLSLKFIKNEKSIYLKKLDLKGFILIALGFSFLSFSLENLSEKIFPKVFLIILMFIGSIILIYYIFYSKKIKNPIINLKLFQTKSFKLANIQLLISISTLGGISFLIPILLQSQFKMTPLHSGIMVLPIAIGAIFIRFFVSKLVSIFGYRKILIINPLIISSSVLLLSFIKENSIYLIIIFGFLFGIFYTLQISVTSILGYLDIKPIDKSNATSIQSSSIQLSMNMAICFSALFLNFFLALNNAKLGILNNTNEVILSFQYCFIIMSFLFLLNSFFAYFLDKKI